MWLFTTRGFFSVVEKWDDPTLVQVRARIAQDLDWLREVCPSLTETKHTTTTDYPYRALAGKVELGAALAKMVVEQLDYTNFKAEVEKKQGRPREELYARVWSVMFGAEDKLKRQVADQGPPDLAWKPVQKGQLEEFVQRGVAAQKAVEKTIAPKRVRKKKPARKVVKTRRR